MTTRIVLQVFDQYQKARMQFIQTVTDLASKHYNIEYLDNAGVLDLLCPLLWDVVPAIQQLTVIALGRLANHNLKIAQIILKKNFMSHIFNNIEKQTDPYKKAILFLLRALAKHSPDMALTVVSEGGLETIVLCLEDYSPSVIEAAAWAVGYISRHNQCLAQAVIDSGTVPLLVILLQESELNLKQICVSALNDISKHDKEQAQAVVDAGAITLLSKLICNEDPRLKRQVLATLSCIAKHSVELAECVIEAQVFPNVFFCMRHTDESVARAAAILTKEICKHSLELSQLISNAGGIEFLIEMIGTKKSSNNLATIMAIGYIAGYSDELAWTVIELKGSNQLALILKQEQKSAIVAITIWALGQIGKHSLDHAKSISQLNILSFIMSLYVNPQSSDDLKIKCKATLKQILQKCTHIEALEPLLHDAPVSILKYILGQFSQILITDAKARRLFVTTGGLKRIQEIQAEPGSTLSEYISMINFCFPEEIIRYYSPGYSNTLLEAVDQYQPNCSLNERKCEFINEADSSLGSVEKKN